MSDRPAAGHRLIEWWLRSISPTPGFADSLHGDLIEERSRLAASGAGPLTIAVRLMAQLIEVSARLVGLQVRGRLGGRRSRMHGGGGLLSPRPGSRAEKTMHGLLDDLRYALRGLRRSPLFAAMALLTLWVGIGASTAMFGLLETVLLRALPYAEPEGIVMVWPVFNDRGPGELSAAHAELFDIRERARSFRHVAAVDYRDIPLGGASEPEEVLAAAVSAELFPLLGIEPDRGRSFTAAEDAPGGDRVVMLSQELWARRFGADPRTLGSEIRLGSDLHTVVGIMPSGFRLPTDYGSARSSELWVPLRLDPADPGFRGFKDLDAIVARLADGVTMAMAQEDLSAVAAALQEAHPDSYPAERGWSLVARRPLAAARDGVQPTLALMMAAVTLLLVIAAVNVVHLLIGRTRERRGELTVRLALGAGRGQLLRQFLAESIVLSLLAAAGGLLVAQLAIALARAALPSGFPRLHEVGIDGSVLAFAVLVSAAIAVVLGTVPSLWVARDRCLSVEAPRGGRSGSAGGGRMLVVAELALAVVLTVTSGLLVRTLRAYAAVDTGFDAEGVITFGLSLPAERYETAVQIRSFYSRIAEEIETLPGVIAAGAARRRPLAEPMGTWAISIEADGSEVRPEAFPDWQVITHGYPGVLRLELEEGRLFEGSEGAGSPAVALVNRAMAKAYWPGGSPLGRRLRLDGSEDNPWVTVVGVVGDVRHVALDAEVAPKMYLLHSQYAALSSVTAVRSLFLLVRATGDPDALVPALRETVWRLDPELPVTDVATMEAIVSASLSRPRLVATVLSLLAAIAVGLATSGVYGVMASGVARRHREIGIRIALGADRRSILTMVLRDGLIATVGGLALGAAGALAISRLTARFLYRVEPTDPLTFAGVAILLATVALGASYLPARRATRVDPVAAIADGVSPLGP